MLDRWAICAHCGGEIDWRQLTPIGELALDRRRQILLRASDDRCGHQWPARTACGAIGAVHARPLGDSRRRADWRAGPRGVRRAGPGSDRRAFPAHEVILTTTTRSPR